jgi:mono/diheme cytochrome c family protein
MRRLLAILVVAAITAVATARADDAKQLFEKSVRPLLARKCFECHSSKADELKGNLKLETVEQILKGGDQGPAVVVGDKESFLLRAIRYEVEDFQMPPGGRLDDKDIALIEKWVQALGAEVKRDAGRDAGWERD